MIGLNLHALVRPIITAIQPDEAVTLYQSAGQANVAGAILSKYAAPQTVMAQVQTASDAVLSHSDRVGMNDVTRTMYLFADAALPPAGIIRPLARGGDVLQRADGTWWLIIAVPEDFSVSCGWVQVRCSLQVLAPDFTASDWWEVTP